MIDTVELEPRQSSSVTTTPHVILLVHGIRTFGGWQERLEKLIRERQPKTEVYLYKYGYVDALTFLVPLARARPVRRLRRYLATNLDRWTSSRTVSAPGLWLVPCLDSTIRKAPWFEPWS
jgi:hypothetical protein